VVPTRNKITASNSARRFVPDRFCRTGLPRQFIEICDSAQASARAWEEDYSSLPEFQNEFGDTAEVQAPL
jgi:hypothetical protein